MKPTDSECLKIIEKIVYNELKGNFKYDLCSPGDLLSEAWIAVDYARKKYDSNLNNNFGAWARMIVRQRIFNYIRLKAKQQNSRLNRPRRYFQEIAEYDSVAHIDDTYLEYDLLFENLQVPTYMKRAIDLYCAGYIPEELKGIHDGYRNMRSAYGYFMKRAKAWVR